MRLTDYINAPSILKEEYFDTLSMQVGLRYFGGKSVIGKYLINRIFEMQAYRATTPNIKPAKIFVDCFTGGGKMALTIPTGWFDVIVMNDLNFGVYSFYKCCQECPLQLLEMIETIGKIMCRDTFFECAQFRSKLKFFETKKEREDAPKPKDTRANRILSGAMTFWVTQGSWLGETDPERVTYAFGTEGKSESLEIEKAINIARKRIMQINEKMTRQKYIVLNEDYKNVLENWQSLFKEKGVTIENKEEILWYLDPPYHEATLNKSNYNRPDIPEEEKDKIINDKEKTKESKPAPYEDSFPIEMTMEMTELLKDLKWFIKSDYDPALFFKPEEYVYTTGKYKGCDCYHDFDVIENIEEGFLRENLGAFHKGTSSGKDVGYEVIWSKYDGTPESLEFMGITEEDREFWEKKKRTKAEWDKKHKH